MVDKLLKALLVVAIAACGFGIALAITTPDSVRGPVGVCYVSTADGMVLVESPVVTDGTVSCRAGSFVSAVPVEVH